MRVIQERVTHPDQAFRHLRFATDGSPGQWHRHRQVELTWIERGQGIRFVGDSAEPYGDGDMILLGPWVPHLWLSAAEPGQASVVQFPPEMLRAPGLPELAPVQAVVERAALGLRITDPARQAVGRVLESMSGASALRRLGRLLELFDILVQAGPLLQPLASTAWPAPAEGRGDRLAERRIQRVVEWIHRSLHGPLPMAQAAALAHVTPASFSRFFRRETGKTYSRYVGDVRCSAACLRLRQTGQPIAHIALECGYGTLSNFNRQFLSRTGLTPRAYRQGAEAAQSVNR